MTTTKQPYNKQRYNRHQEYRKNTFADILLHNFKIVGKFTLSEAQEEAIKAYIKENLKVQDDIRLF